MHETPFSDQHIGHYWSCLQPSRVKVVILECSEDKKDKPPTIEQIQKATSDDPDRIPNIIIGKLKEEDYGEKYPYYHIYGL